ncbi:hypothetical protein ABEF91_003354 [Exophiala dermatitidis]
MLLLHRHAHTSCPHFSHEDLSLPLELDPTVSHKVRHLSDHNIQLAETMSILSSGPVTPSPAGRATAPLRGLETGENDVDQMQNDERRRDVSADVAEAIASELETRTISHLSLLHSPAARHTIHLSSIEQCMPRSYIRMCLAYRVPDATRLPQILTCLDAFVRKLIDAKPYLSGFVVAVTGANSPVGAVQIEFTDDDFLHYPCVTVRRLTREEVPYTYDELNQNGLPPSAIRPDLVSALGEAADQDRAPVFRVQANVLEGGLVVSLYLHHCISDGTGMGLLMTGSVLNDDFAFDRHLDARGHDIPRLSLRLEAFAHHKSVLRQHLSYSFANQINDRQLKCKTTNSASQTNDVAKPRGRGCVVAFPLSRLATLKAMVEKHADGHFITPNDVLQALIWQCMTRARIASLRETTVTTSKLLIPINIRNRLKRPLPESYFGAAIDFASVQLPLSHLADTSLQMMARTAMEIRKSINKVDEPYIRQAISLARYPDPQMDTRDLQASNMDRVNGADMYITSWEKLRCYEATLEMGLGPPDWVRKPWSKDPGSCIILPYDKRKDYLEVVIQMTEEDMARLLDDSTFMEYVARVID